MPKDFLYDHESIFLNDVALSYDFIPKEIPHRENEHHYIATCIKPLFENRNGKNLFIFGPPGIGKTLAIKSILKELEETSDEIIPIYINSWKHDTSHKILLEICNLIGYKFVQDKSSNEIMQEIKKILNKKSLVFCFDEIDKLTNYDILYFILEDIYRKTIILITNEKSWANALDLRLKSRLYPELLEFRPYSYEETLDILKQRLEYTFVPNVFEKNCLDEIAKKTFELGDIRAGIYLLKESGEQAESRSSKKIILQDVENAIKKLTEFKIKSSKDLDIEQIELLNLVKANSGKSASEIYKLYNKDISYKTFRRRLESLQDAKQINLEEKRKGNQGKITYVYFGVSKKLSEF
ncbi:MAG: AAA family ATPase [Nanoarchaeota archaeon]